MTSSRAAFSVRMVIAAAASFLVVLGGAASARAQSSFEVCGLQGRLACAVIRSSLDPAGHTPGRVSLAAVRYEQTRTANAGTIIAIAGGPGQSAIGALPDFIDALRPVLRDRALVVFDERGIGLSGPLECRSRDTLARCAERLGPRRAFYSTVASIGDVEAVRQALHADHVALAGVSYGTFLALAYAQAQPQHVDHLVLDSVVPADGEPALGQNSLAAMRDLLGRICQTACAGVDPLGDLSTLLTNLSRKPVHFDNGYSRLMVTENVASELVYGALVGSDIDPLVRASLPAALHLAAAGDLSALGRLATLTQLTAGASGPSRSGAVVKHKPSLHPVNVEGLATLCEDTRWPWASTDAQATRASKARDAFGSLAAGAFAPFDRKTIFDFSAFKDCEHWPEAGNTPKRVAAPFPSISTLVLSGRDDLRTPNADAAALAASLPAATLVTVPNVGHSVLSSDTSGCAGRALAALFAGQAIAQCAPATPAHVDPLPPVSVESLAPAPGFAGTAGRVLAAAVLTLRHDVGLVLPALAVAGESEGTRDGYLVVRGSPPRARLALRSLTYVPGVALTGSLAVGGPSPFVTGSVRVSNRGRRFGQLTLEPNGAIHGHLQGRRFRLSLTGRTEILDAGSLSSIPGATPVPHANRGVRGARL